MSDYLQRRKFISLILAGLILPEYLLKGRSMVSMPSMLPLNIETPLYYNYDKNSLGYTNRIRQNAIYKFEYRKIGTKIWTSVNI